MHILAYILKAQSPWSCQHGSSLNTNPNPTAGAEDVIPRMKNGPGLKSVKGECWYMLSSA